MDYLLFRFNLALPYFKQFPRLDLLYAETLMGQENEKIFQALDIFEKLRQKNDVYDDVRNRAVENIYYAYLQLDYEEKALDLLKILGNCIKEDRLLCAKGCLFYQQKRLQEAKDCLEKCVAEGGAQPVAYYQLARVVWDIDESSPEIPKLLHACAKRDSYYYRAFLWLGYYYYLVLKNPEKAVRCYERAHLLNPFNSEIGIALRSVY